MTDQQDPNVSPDELLRAKLNMETSLISWLELQRHYAAGNVLHVSSELDLIEAAFQLAKDNKVIVAQWAQSETVKAVSDEQAKAWFNMKTELWAIVVAPWVLVQDRSNQK